VARQLPATGHAGSHERDDPTSGTYRGATAIWATQVLKNLAKTGQPSRAEITDAAGRRAECVMPNNGPHIARPFVGRPRRPVIVRYSQFRRLNDK